MLTVPLGQNGVGEKWLLFQALQAVDNPQADSEFDLLVKVRVTVEPAD